MLGIIGNIVQILALYAAFFYGKTMERPESRWPKGGVLQGGWKAWRTYAMVLIGISLLLNAWPLLSGGMGGGGGFGMGGGGGYGGW